MHKHHFDQHSTQKYSCSTCLKTFTRRQAYRRHLVTHQETPKLQCPKPGCVKIFIYNCNLKRHVKTHQVSTSVVDKLLLQEEKNETVSYEIDLLEKRKDGMCSGILTVKELSSFKYKRNCTSFQNSLGFSTLDDWDNYVEISNTLSLPLSGSTDPEAVEVSFYVDELGTQLCKFAWNSAQQTQAYLL